MDSCKVNLLCLVLVLILANVNARIWFVGDQMPGTNMTITEAAPITTEVWVPETNPVHEEKMDILEIIGHGVTNMALAMEKVAGNERDNLVFAPLSVAAALSVILLGARGQTNAEISDFLGLLTGLNFTERTDVIHRNLGKYFTKFEKSTGAELGSQLAFASGIFVQEGYPISTKFYEMARNIYDSEVLPLDFFNDQEHARQFVNQWVANRTDNRIKNILGHPLSHMTSVIVANALYFNGPWEYPFSSSTKLGKFHVNKQETIQIPLMVNAADVPYHSTNDYRIFGMPYKGVDLVMYIVLPERNLHQFVSNLTADSIENMINQTKVLTVLYVVPRMKMESTLSLRKPLQELGVRSLFDPKSADLSGISKGIVANDVYHKVEIQVTETGTIAAASSATGLIRGGVPFVKVDRPFLFFIYHNPTNTISFWGSVYKPTPYFGR